MFHTNGQLGLYALRAAIPGIQAQFAQKLAFRFGFTSKGTYCNYKTMYSLPKTYIFSVLHNIFVLFCVKHTVEKTIFVKFNNLFYKK